MVLRDEDGNEVFVFMIGVKKEDYNKLSDEAKKRGKPVSDFMVWLMGNGLKKISSERKG